MAKVDQWVTASGALVEKYESEIAIPPLYKVTWTTEPLSSDTFTFDGGIEVHIHEQGVGVRSPPGGQAVILWHGAACYGDIDFNVTWTLERVFCRAALLDEDGETLRVWGAIHFTTHEADAADIDADDLEAIVDVDWQHWQGDLDALTKAVAQKCAGHYGCFA